MELLSQICQHLHARIFLKKLKKYNHKAKKKVHTPVQPLPKRYGKAAQEIPEDNTKLLNNKDDKKFIQRVVRSFILRLCSGSVNIARTKHNYQLTIKPYHNNFGTNKSFLALHGHLPGSHDQILCIQYGPQCTLGCVLPHGTKSKKYNWRNFFPCQNSHQ